MSNMNIKVLLSIPVAAWTGLSIFSLVALGVMPAIAAEANENQHLVSLPVTSDLPQQESIRRAIPPWLPQR